VRAKNAVLSSYGQKCNLRRPSFYALINKFENFSPDGAESSPQKAVNKVAGPATLLRAGFRLSQVEVRSEGEFNSFTTRDAPKEGQAG